MTSANATSGSRITWQASATTTALGRRATREKSFGVRSSPSPSMMTASATGSPIVSSDESMAGG